MHYLEDFARGKTYELGTHTVTAEEITGFAKRWDPQRFHLDAYEPVDGPFGGRLVASGWHTAAIFMRLYVEAVLADSSCIRSPGVDELRWLVPVRPGDTLSGRLTVEKVVASDRHPGRGTVHLRCELRNQDDILVFSMVLRSLFTCLTTAS